MAGLTDSVNNLRLLGRAGRADVADVVVERLVDYCRNTPRDPLRSAACVEQRVALIEKNLIRPRPGL